MLITGLGCAKISPKILKIPQTVLLPIIACLCIVGAFSNSNNLFDVLIAIIFGIIDFGMKKFGYSGAPLVLGPLAESNLNRALILSGNSWMTFVTHPISCVFLIMSVFIIVFSVIKNVRERKMKAKIEIRLDRVRALMSEKSFDGLYLRGQDNFAWLSCGGRNYVGMGAAGICGLLVTADKCYAITNNIEAPRMRDEEHLEELGFELRYGLWYDNGFEKRTISELVPSGKVA